MRPATLPAAVADDRSDALVATSLGYVRVDRSGLIVDWNPAAERLFGWTREEVLGVPVADTIIPPQLRSAHTAGFARRLVTGEGRTLGRRIDVPARHRDGSELRVSMVVDMVGDGGFCALVSDRTDWHSAEQELRRSNDLVNAILRHTPAMISARDLAGRYLFVNAAYETVVGLPSADIVGRGDAELLPPVVVAASRAYDAQVADSGSALTVFEELPVGGSIRRFAVTRFPLTDPDGSVYGVCSIAVADDSGAQTFAPLLRIDGP